jgi:hypothetical protein
VGGGAYLPLRPCPPRLAKQLLESWSGLTGYFLIKVEGTKSMWDLGDESMSRRRRRRRRVKFSAAQSI